MPGVNDILRQVYGFRGLAFPTKPDGTAPDPIAPDFRPGLYEGSVTERTERTGQGTPLWGTNVLGRPVFMPALLGGVELSNPLITITGENEILETDVTEIGTVFEKVFQRPYDITIICTLLNKDNTWPEAEIKQFRDLYVQGVLYTLECAITDLFLQPKNNFILKTINLLDMQGVENAQVIELTGRSNLDFELEILN